MEAWRGMFVQMGFMIMQRAGGQLVEGFYKSSCPNVEDIMKKAVTAKYMETNISGPSTFSLFFHDCSVEGCDASILIASANGDSERDAEANLSLRREGFDTVNRSKIAVENECPGVVSCADILALAARDVVVLTGGPTLNVELGRRDGLISQASRVAENIPDSSFNLSQLKTIFHKKNLSTTDMIALSSAHTLGVSHCRPITKHLYGSSTDPYLPKNFAKQLRMICPQNDHTNGSKST